jgi:hypothetical protein
VQDSKSASYVLTDPVDYQQLRPNHADIAFTVIFWENTYSAAIAGIGGMISIYSTIVVLTTFYSKKFRKN